MLKSEFKADFDTKKLQQLSRDLKTIQKRHIKFGWFTPKQHPTAGVPIAQVAHWQEYGRPASDNANKIPSRPYFRQAINAYKYSSTTTQTLGDVFGAVLRGQGFGDVDSYLWLVAEKLRTYYATSVAMQNYDELHPYTIAKKGHKYQMFDSGVMINSFDAKVFKTSQDGRTRNVYL